MGGDVDVAAIREAAERSLPGPWTSEKVGSATLDLWHVNGPDWPNGRTSHIVQVAGRAMGDTAEFIATMDPPTTLALLDALDAARAEVERLTIKHAVIDRMAEQRDELRAERDAIAEKIAVAIEAACPGCEMAVECDYQIAARIAREVGKA